MPTTSSISYGTVAATSLPFDQAIERVKSLLKDEGFGILCEINVTKTLKEKINADFRPYVILGACNPQLAHQALSSEAQLGLLLPCNVVVQAQDDQTLISVVDAQKMLDIVGNPELGALAREANMRLQRVMEKLPT